MQVRTFFRIMADSLLLNNDYTEENPLTNSAKLDNITIRNGYMLQIHLVGKEFFLFPWNFPLEWEIEYMITIVFLHTLYRFLILHTIS